MHMLTSPSEIGGVHASEEKRREYAMASRDWRSKDGVVDHGRMVAIGVFPPPLIDDIDNSIAPAEDTEHNIIEEYQDDASLRINGDKDDDGNEQQGEAIFDRVMRLRSVSTSSSSLGRNALDIITYSSEEETVELVQVKAKTIGIEHVQRDRNYRSHKIVRSKAEKNATMTIASANFESKRTTRKEESTRHVNVVKEREQRGILIIVLKRITLELIKLPLRILSIMLMIIGGLLGLI